MGFSPLNAVSAPVKHRQRYAGTGQLQFGGALVGLMLLLALFGPLLSRYGYEQQDLGAGSQFLQPSAAHWLGTDDLGRDVFTRLAVGARVSLSIGLGVESFALLMGLTLGLLAGYHGGRLETAIMRLTDLMFAFPDLLLAILIAGILVVRATHPLVNLLSVFVALSVGSWPGMARLVRGQALELRHREFVEAARILGASDLRIMTRHLLPNLIAPVLIALATETAGVILAESTLSFLGIGVQPPFPSWGSMISSGMTNFRSHPEQVFFPAVTLALAVLGFNFLGDGLRDRYDPRMRGA
jgi:ABC-type dipeptide/oligopeptide/nickel transport system permease subunit